MSGKKFDAIVAGHLCLDMIPSFDNDLGRTVADIFIPGSLFSVGGLAVATGGAVSNTGIALKKYGLDVGFVSKVGADAVGRQIIELMDQNGSTEGIKVSPGEASSYSVVLAPVGIDRIFFHCSGTNDTFGSEDIDYDLLSRARLFHLGYPPLMKGLYADDGLELSQIFKKAKEAGVTTSLDLSLPNPDSPAGRADWPAIMRKTLPYVDIFVPSIEEAFLFLDRDAYLQKKDDASDDPLSMFSPGDFSRLAQMCIDLGCPMVALKASSRGWYLKTSSEKRLRQLGILEESAGASWADREVWCPAFEIDRIASSTGAGDVSIAGFFVALLKGHSLAQCLRYANAAAHQNLRQLDATSGLSGWDVLTREIDALVMADLFLSGEGWRRDDTSQIWERRS